MRPQPHCEQKLCKSLGKKQASSYFWANSCAWMELLAVIRSTRRQLKGFESRLIIGSVVREKGWVGFASVGPREEALHLYSLRLSPEPQASKHGARRIEYSHDITVMCLLASSAAALCDQWNLSQRFSYQWLTFALGRLFILAAPVGGQRCKFTDFTYFITMRAHFVA